MTRFLRLKILARRLTEGDYVARRKSLTKEEEKEEEALLTVR